MSSAKHILLLGGHGKVSLLMTPKLVSRSWNLTSVIRNPDQKQAILDAGKAGPGKVDVLIASLEDVKSDNDAHKILDQVKPDWVVWSAGKFQSPPFPFNYLSLISCLSHLCFYSGDCAEELAVGLKPTDPECLTTTMGDMILAVPHS